MKIEIFKGEELLKRTFVYLVGVCIFFALWNFKDIGGAFVGATIVKGSLVLMNTDLSGNKIRSAITFFIIFIYIGIFSYLASLNLYVGFFINFISIFLLTYNFSSNLKPFIWRPFVLGYLYLLIEPGTLHNLPYRLVVLGLGVTFVMFAQIIVNKNKGKRKIDENLKGLLDKIVYKLNIILKEGKTNGVTYNINENVEKIIESIYSKRIDPYFITKRDNKIFNITLNLERLNYLVRETEINLENKDEVKLIQDLRNFIMDIENSNRNNLKERIDIFLAKHKKLGIEHFNLYEILQSLAMFRESLEEKNEYSLKDIIFNRKIRKDITTVFSFRPSKKSIRFSFAFRASILLAGTYFLVKVLKIEEGKWIMFTIYAVIEPFYENAKKRFPKRFTGTLLGIGIFLIIYLLISNIYIQGVLFVISYYFYVIAKDFKIKTMCTATVSLGLFSIVTHTPARGIVLRFFFVLIGILIGYLGTKYIMPYDIKSGLKTLIKNYYNLTQEMKDMIIEASKDEYAYKIFKEKIFIARLYESRIISNNNIIKNQEITNYLYNQRLLDNLIYQALYFLKYKEYEKEIFYKLQFSLKNNLEFQIEKEYNKEKILEISVNRILIRCEKSKKLKEEILKSINK